MRRVMVFGRPGSGKSTFAYALAAKTGLPVYHLDKIFFKKGWVEQDERVFVQMQEAIISKSAWIVDGNATRSLELRWQKADLVLYFNFSKALCLWRLVKRLIAKRASVDDRAEGCSEILRFKLIRYMWTFERRVEKIITQCQTKYPSAHFMEINSDKDLERVWASIQGSQESP